eukprot:TRINITY_DN11298_c1_g1_i2.p1 TRINITY_DN11298_c1_g1~~TRINITY_DN11298_c1_g1_i2.p1  ORF type:complete len:615 (-),score=105.18 TRINITY_DN11298_c1_g1_i2:155-1999(-)
MRNPGLGCAGMDSIFSGFVLDPAKCSELSLAEKQELVYEISQWPKNAPEILQSWSRRELLEVICAEMGKERKYTGVTKTKMIEHLLRLVTEKKSSKNANHSPPLSPLSPTKTRSVFKRHKKKEDSLRSVTALDRVSVKVEAEEQKDILHCQNFACRAALSPEDVFCKRCSCCICHHYDDNKDPSLWLVCGSDDPDENNLCGISCHLKCALQHERSGVVKNKCHTKLDGSFCCCSCGKENGLMGSWRKQLLVAKDARRVDVLCFRISLCHKILKGTERYKELQKIVNTAVKRLKKEVGPLERVSAKMARGIVNRLQCAAEVQKLCSIAVEVADKMIFGVPEPLAYANTEVPSSPAWRIHFEHISPISVAIVLDYSETQSEDIIGCRLWHRKSTDSSYLEEPSSTLLRPETRSVISGLYPSTEYFFKISPFTGQSQLGEQEFRWITQTPRAGTLSSDMVCMRKDSFSTLDEEHEAGDRAFIIETDSQRDSTNSNRFVHVNHVPPPMPCKPVESDQGLESGNRKQSMEREYEYCVKVIRWLECEGHMEKEFRVKFLTWFSLKATMQERRVVSAFIDTLIDDPPSLVGQLVDAFTDGICGKVKAVPVSWNSLCRGLWH